MAISCASTKKEIAQQKEKMPDIQTPEELRKTTRNIIATSENLSEGQKNDFLKLHESVISEVRKINNESRKLKAVMFNHLANESYDNGKVREIEKQLKKLNNKKIDIMFKAMSDARKILGVEFKHIYPEMMNHTDRI